MNTYEGMFLFDPAVATDWDQVKAELERIMERAEGKIVACGKWDERRLAYEIRGCKRAIYVLVYFEASAEKIVGLERDVHLSESVIRCLVLRADHVTPEQMQENTAPAGKAEPGSPARDGAPSAGTEAATSGEAKTEAAVAVQNAEPEAKAQTESADAPSPGGDQADENKEG